MNYKKIGIVLSLLLCALPVSGCVFTKTRAIYLKSGTVCKLDEEVEVKASVPGDDGKLVPGTLLTLPEGTEFKYGGTK